ncbi:retroviral-like aspartic protease family protein [Flavobacterium sp. NRK F10]|uniref:Acid protease n=1 Tax=Flavobacterium sediminis TaxID=2201181 RepID=A0A2U8QUG1_9FLAO|nr:MULTISPECIES: retropepsin-like aspartic protease [Flavobacterium]AWM13798.1 acid protease [Flavobacterium sediminis]MCO6174958.1 retroviral-like aspartic protease family protein [Flavobacterium sp. NRK F10]
MEDLQDFLKENKYKKVRFKVLKTQHLLVKAKINGISGIFILDTGASNSCVGFEGIEKFKLRSEESETKASGAGATGMNTLLAKNNILQAGRWKDKKLHLIVFDMSHVNNALEQYKIKPVDGIIGADILLKGKAIIDYYNHLLFLK